ncbi:Jacalin-like lectin domain-containing protein [Mycotypha africana]|uniref:Jacalin-like lectin domain-containing protein n=1 Tax=Mycotypha africana TaxID=64632 RepID=UPI002301C618|nr:Jacalin-like lectin domain-containing protein [Mycotypha africana]KAI8977679.1 Jacalin-like lectin domain-containing protein [Mycotypha africana]
MSRGYNNWNRTFLAKEPGRGPITPQEEEGSQWHRVDILRLRFHPAFRIPEDGPIGVKDLSKPSFTALENNHLQISSPAGLTLIEILVNGRYRTHYEFVQEQPKSITLSLSDICQKCSCDLNREQVSLAAVCANQEHKQLDHLSNFLSSHRVTNLQGLNGIILKSDIYGASSEEGKDKSFAIFFDNNQQRKQLRRIKVNHGAFLDGFTLIYKDGSQSQVGKTDGGCSEFDISPGEQIQGFYVSNGAWIDGIQFKLSSGRVSPWFGGKGGGISHVEPPEGYEIVGVFASAARWMEQFGIFYRRC